MKFDRLVLLGLVALCALLARWWVKIDPGRPLLPDCAYEIHLLPLGGSLPPGLHEAVESFTGKSVRVDLGQPMPAEAWVGPPRQQYDAEKVRLRIDKGQFVLAITPCDLFTSQVPDWRYCFGARYDQGGIVSSARMGPFPGESGSAALERLKKMALRYVLEGAYGMQRGDDPRSLLFRSVLGPADLDRMEFRL